MSSTLPDWAAFRPVCFGERIGRTDPLGSYSYIRSCGPYAKRAARRPLVSYSSADAEMCDQFAVTLDVGVTDVVEQSTTLTNEHQ